MTILTPRVEPSFLIVLRSVKTHILLPHTPIWEKHLFGKSSLGLYLDDNHHDAILHELHRIILLIHAHGFPSAPGDGGGEREGGGGAGGDGAEEEASTPAGKRVGSRRAVTGEQ